MRCGTVLLANSLYSLTLGTLLIDFRAQVVNALGMPTAECCFYPSLLGAALIGFAASLLIQAADDTPTTSCGVLTVAFCVNLCSASMLVVWLVASELSLALHGRLFLWLIACATYALAGAELLARQRSRVWKY